MKVNEYKYALQEALQQINVRDIIRFAERINKTKGIVYIVANGGSNATASHFAEDLLKAAGIRAIAIDSSPLITAYGNDCGYGQAFNAVIRLATEDDLIIGISGSGNSENVYNCSFSKAPMIALLGMGGGKIGTNNLLEDMIIVFSNVMEIIEDCHLAISHMIVMTIKEATGQ